MKESAHADTGDCIIVFTADTTQDLIAKRGSGDWILDPQRASHCKYLVCCRKSRWNNMEDPAPGGAAFLVGAIKRLVPGVKNKRGQQRYFVEIAQYAVISRPGVWKDWRNPVRYDDLKNLGIDLDSIDLKPTAGASGNTLGTSRATGPARLTIAQAKEALAATFGVRPEDIEIHIKG